MISIIFFCRAKLMCFLRKCYLFRFFFFILFRIVFRQRNIICQTFFKRKKRVINLNIDLSTVDSKAFGCIPSKIYTYLKSIYISPFPGSSVCWIGIPLLGIGLPISRYLNLSAICHRAITFERWSGETIDRLTSRIVASPVNLNRVYSSRPRRCWKTIQVSLIYRI